MSMDRIQAPVDLTLFDHHTSSLKSRSDVWSQSSISAFWRAASSGSAAMLSNAPLTSAQKILSFNSWSAVSMTYALYLPAICRMLNAQRIPDE